MKLSDKKRCETFFFVRHESMIRWIGNKISCNFFEETRSKETRLELQVKMREKSKYSGTNRHAKSGSFQEDANKKEFSNYVSRRKSEENQRNESKNIFKSIRVWLKSPNIEQTGWVKKKILTKEGACNVLFAFIWKIHYLLWSCW